MAVNRLVNNNEPLAVVLSCIYSLKPASEHTVVWEFLGQNYLQMHHWNVIVQEFTHQIFTHTCDNDYFGPNRKYFMSMKISHPTANAFLGMACPVISLVVVSSYAYYHS